jgi:hypothetical protein
MTDDFVRCDVFGERPCTGNQDAIDPVVVSGNVNVWGCGSLQDR